MKTISDHYLCGIDYDEISDKFKNNQYARLEINLRYPYNHEIVIPHK